MTPPAAPDARQKFLGIEVGRGVATSLVAMQHAGIFAMQIDHARIAPFGGVVLGLHIGVDFFFVLSGFLITWLHWSDIGNAKRLKFYLLRRFTRIYPAYWCVLIPLIAVHVIAGREGIASVLTSLLLFPTAGQPILGVAWTLVFEVFFYLGFGAIILGGKRSAVVLPLWVGAVLIGCAAAAPHGFPASFFLSPYNLEFITGIAVARILRRTTVPFPGCFLGLGSLVFLGAAYFRLGTIISPESLEYRAIFGLSAGLIVLGIVEIDRAGRWAYPKWLLLFGSASYAIYLTHSLVEAGVAKILAKAAGRISPDLLTILIAASGIFFGILFHLSVERKVMHKINVFLFPERHKRPITPGGALSVSGNAVAVRLGRER